MLTRLLTLLGLFAFTPAFAATIVQAGKLLDQPGEAPRAEVSLLIVDGQISELRDGYLDGAAFGLPDAQVFNLRKAFVLPGLIDSHVHLTGNKGGVERAIANVENSPADTAYEAAVNARKTINAGFTTVRNLGDRDGVIRAGLGAQMFEDEARAIIETAQLYGRKVAARWSAQYRPA